MPNHTRILVADDDHFIRTFLAETLELFGYEVILAVDGEEALRKARSEHPALILLDILMPRRIGTEVAKELKGHPATSRIPIIIVTSLPAMPAGLKELVEAYVQKPVRVQDLMKLVWKFAPATEASPRPADSLPSQLAQTGERK